MKFLRWFASASSREDFHEQRRLVRQVITTCHQLEADLQQIKQDQHLPRQQWNDLYVVSSSKDVQKNSRKLRNFSLDGPAFDWDIVEFVLSLRGDPQQMVERYRNRLKSLTQKKLISENVGTSILDLGCGDGKITSILAKNLPTLTEIHGSDMVDLQFVERVSQAASGSKVLFHQNGILDILNKDFQKKFDVIVMIQVLEHLTSFERIKVLPLLLQRLTKTGFAYMEFPNYLNSTVRADTFWMDPEHTRPVSIRQIIEALNQLPCQYDFGVYTADNQVMTSDEYFARKNAHFEQEYMDFFFILRPDRSTSYL